MRLHEDIKTHRNGKFITLTFNTESLQKLAFEVNHIKEDEGVYTERKNKLSGYELDNAIAVLAMRRFLELWRKHNKKSVRHWCVTELGHKGTEHLHIHGIIWCNDVTEIEKRWKYGFVWTGKTVKGKKLNYVNDRTIGYITKYVMKVDEEHRYYKAMTLCSPGIGQGYTKRADAKHNKFNGKDTNKLS